MNSSLPVDSRPRRAAGAQRVNFITDAVTLVVLLAMAATGLLLRFVLPPGSRGGQGLQLWGYTRHEWGDVHFWLAAALGALFIVHVALHWTWVCAMVARWLRTRAASAGPISLKRRSAYGVGFLLAVSALLVGFVWVASINTTQSGHEPERSGRGYRGGRTAAVLGGDASGSPSAAPLNSSKRGGQTREP